MGWGEIRKCAEQYSLTYILYMPLRGWERGFISAAFLT